MALAFARSFDPDEVAPEVEVYDEAPPLVPVRAARPEPKDLTELAARVARVGAASHERVLPLHPALGPLVGGLSLGLRKGTTVAVGGPAPGATSLGLALVAAASAEGSWCAVVGLTHLHAPAAAALGCDLERLVLIEPPGPERWAVVVAALLDGLDLVVVGVPERVGVGDARRLAARARERGSVLVVVEPGAAVLEAGLAAPGRWPEAPDLRLGVDRSRWTGLDQGAGFLQARRLDARGNGRRAAARERRVVLGLPGPTGAVAEVAAAPTERPARQERVG